MTGCSLLVEIPLLYFATGPGSIAGWSLPICNCPDLLGLQFHTQSLQLDPSANPFGATTTQGLSHRIGGR
jgi:hypothetical protein